jgi:predicted amidophosphoribosyltransferase
MSQQEKPGPEAGAGGSEAAAGGAGADTGRAAAGRERIGARIARFLRTGWTCGQCGKETLPSDKFCTRCGTAITPTRHDGAPPVTRVTCVNCAARLGVNDAFCGRCGTGVVKLAITL